MKQTTVELPVRLKDPNSHEDFSVDWTDYLQSINDSLATVGAPQITPSVAGGVKLLDPPSPPGGASYGISGNITYAWLAAGVAGKTYVVTFSVTTTGGRTTEQSLRIQVQNL